MNNKIYVGNLDYSIQADELKAAFSQWEITDCIVIEGKGFGFVTFAEASSASTAKEELNNKELKGRPMKIDFAQERSRDNNRSSYGGGKKSGFQKRY